MSGGPASFAREGAVVGEDPRVIKSRLQIAQSRDYVAAASVTIQPGPLEMARRSLVTCYSNSGYCPAITPRTDHPLSALALLRPRTGRGAPGAESRRLCPRARHGGIAARPVRFAPFRASAHERALEACPRPLGWHHGPRKRAPRVLVIDPVRFLAALEPAARHLDSLTNFANCATFS